MGPTTSTEPQRLYKGAFYLFTLQTLGDAKWRKKTLGFAVSFRDHISDKEDAMTVRFPPQTVMFLPLLLGM
jgi:hypothetical protein